MATKTYAELTGSANNTSKQGQLRTSGRKVMTIGEKGINGIYNRHPSPGLGSYPASVGPKDLDVKFAETGVGDANNQTNQMRQSKGVSRKGKASSVSSSNMTKKKNQYRSQGKTKQF